MFDELNIEVIDKNLFIIGFCSIINAYGIRFLWDDLHTAHKEWFFESGIKKIVIFTLLFVTTRSFLVSIFLLFVYMIFKKFLKQTNKKSHNVFN